MNNRNPDFIKSEKRFFEGNQIRIGMDQHRIKKRIQPFKRTPLMFWFFLFDKDIPHAADHTATRKPVAANGLKRRVKLKPKGLAAKRKKFEKKNVRPFLFDNGEQFFLPLFFDLIERCGFIRAIKIIKFPVHLQFRKSYHPDMLWKFYFDLGSAGYQNHVMSNQRPAYFTGSEKMPDPEYMLTVKNNFHRWLNSDLVS
jgi:hypothetical protein